MFGCFFVCFVCLIGKVRAFWTEATVSPGFCFVGRASEASAEAGLFVNLSPRLRQVVGLGLACRRHPRTAPHRRLRAVAHRAQGVRIVARNRTLSTGKRVMPGPHVASPRAAQPSPIGFQPNLQARSKPGSRFALLCPLEGTPVPKNTIANTAALPIKIKPKAKRETFGIPAPRTVWGGWRASSGP